MNFSQCRLWLDDSSNQNSHFEDFRKICNKCAVLFFWFMPFSEVLLTVEFLAKSFDLQSVFPNKETQLPYFHPQLKS